MCLGAGRNGVYRVWGHDQAESGGHMRIDSFVEFIGRDERFVCERDDARSIVRIWSTHVRVPIPVMAEMQAVDQPVRVEYEVDEPGDGAGSGCISIDQHTIAHSSWGWHDWQKLLERELRKRKDSRDMDALLRLAGQVIDGFPDMVTCGNTAGFDLLGQIAAVLGRSDEFMYRVRSCGLLHWLER